MDQGLLVPDEVVIGLVEERISEPDAKGGFMLDGFPRTRPQAEALDTALERSGNQLDAVVQIDAPDSVIEKRITGRRSCKETGRIFHVEYDPPPEDIQVVQRSDDTEEAVRARLEKYHRDTAPIIPFYQEKGLLKKVDGLQSPDKVTADILAVLEIKA